MSYLVSKIGYFLVKQITKSQYKALTLLFGMASLWKATIQVPNESWGDVHHPYANQIHSRFLLREKSEVEFHGVQLKWMKEKKAKELSI